MKKRYIYLLLSISLLFGSCTKEAKIVRDSKTKAKEWFESKKHDPAFLEADVKLNDMETVYSSDSLCILYLKIAGKFTTSEETKYVIEFVSFDEVWVSHGIDSDAKDEVVYFSKEEFEKNKRGKMYENYSYDDAIFYRAALLYNSTQSESDEEVFSYIPMPTGMWERGLFQDDYGKMTKNGYIKLRAKAEKKNDEKKYWADLIVTKDDIFFMLWRKSYSGLDIASEDGNFTVTIETSQKEKIGPLTFRSNDKKGIFLSQRDKSKVSVIRNLLEKEKTFTVYARNDGFWSRGQFRIKFRSKGYNDAMKYIN